MAVYKDYIIKLDTMRTPKIALQNIVAGETGNRLTVTFTNGLSTVSLAASTHRVCLRIDSALGTRRQDSSVENSGISFSNGKAIIMLSREAYTVGLNRCRLEIFSTESEANDTLICSAEFQFTAAGNATGENAGAVYPSLIIAENAANAAAEAANAAAEFAHNEGLWADEKAQAAAAAAAAAQNAGNFVINVVDPYWNGTVFEGYADKTNDEIIAAMESGRIIAVRVADTDDETVYTMIEAYSQPDAHETVCESNHASCTVFVGGTETQIRGELL